MKIIVANTVLPKGAKEITTLKKKIGGWAEMEYDAECERHGLTWYRPKGGLGGDGYSESWVCDLPNGCLSVSAYSWREPRWGFDHYLLFDEAVREKTKAYMERARELATELRAKAASADKTVELLEKALITP